MENNENFSTPEVKKESTIRIVAKVFMLISCIGVGWTLIPLIWMIPMTLKVWHAHDKGESLSVGFKICVLLFVNTVAGILLLVEDAD